MTIIYRTAGAWGPGKGSNLSPEEVDGNFFDLETRVTNIENDPPEPVSIDHFVVDGTLLTIVLTNGDSHGPFVLPIGQWRWTGEWEPDTQYFVGDIVTNEGNTYFIRVQHVSADVFDPGLFTVDGFVYILILAKAAQPYDIGFYFNDMLASGPELIFQHVADREFTIGANFVNAQAYLKVATSTATINLPIFLNGEVLGSITFAPGVDTDAFGGQYGAFSALDPLSGIAVAVRDILAVGMPYDDDATAAILSVTIPSVVASL